MFDASAFLGGGGGGGGNWRASLGGCGKWI